MYRPVKHKRLLASITVGLVPLLLISMASAQTDERTKEEKLYRCRILGIAFFENEATVEKAVDEFKRCVELRPKGAEERVNLGLAFLRSGKLDKAMAELELAKELDPRLPHTYCNIGMIHKRRGDFKAAIAELEQCRELDPENAPIRYSLGLLYRAARDETRAMAEFYEARRLDPGHMSARFQIFNYLNRLGRKEEASEEFRIFTALKRQSSLQVSTDPERSKYSDPIWIVPFQELPRGADAPIEVVFAEATRRARLPSREGSESEGAASRARSALFMDYDSNATQDLVLINEGRGIRLFRNAGNGAFDDVTVASKLHLDFEVTGLSAGDFNGDGFVDLFIFGPEQSALYRNDGAGTFSDATERAGLGGGGFAGAIWFDYDHDNDLDILALGREGNVLYRNNGDERFSNSTADAGLAENAIHVVVGDFKDRNAADLFMIREDGSIVLFEDLRYGKFAGPKVELDPDVTGRALYAKGEDLNNDGLLDLFLVTDGGFLILKNRGEGRFEKITVESMNRALSQGPGPIEIFDYNNDGLADIVVSGRRPGSVHLFANRGSFAFRPDTAAFSKVALQEMEIVGWAPSDFDNDGDVDLLGITGRGEPLLLKNEGGSANRWLKIYAEGRKSPRLPLGAKIEAKAGLFYLKRKVDYLPVHLGLAKNAKLDVVRITWPNGVIQNEMNVDANRVLRLKELERFAGSCPSIFAWNGEKFAYVTDGFLAGPTGVPLARDKYFPLDHHEYIKIEGSQLRPDAGGFYTVQVTEERYEVDFFDQAKLLVIDHPSDLVIYPNEKFSPHQIPEFKIFTAKNARPPVSAFDDQGHDVLRLVEKVDGEYAGHFERNVAFPAIAETHALELDLGKITPGRRIMLYLTGWLHYFDSSTNIAVSQTGSVRFIMPYLQVQDEKGGWTTVIENIGLPQGPNKTLPVDLTGKFTSNSYRVRIVTNMPLYWDQVLVADSDADEDRLVKITELPVARADIHFRGFSRLIIHPERFQLESFDYDSLMPDSAVPWNQVRGNYTRYGEVTELLLESDDKFVIFGSGDELTLNFDASRAPALPEGWRRDFILYLDGWVKDGDLNTAHGESVEPLPFHGMSGYPYGADEQYPSDEDHLEYLRKYNTRSALVLVPPLNGSLSFEAEKADLPPNGEDEPKWRN